MSRSSSGFESSLTGIVRSQCKITGSLDAAECSESDSRVIALDERVPARPRVQALSSVSESVGEDERSKTRSQARSSSAVIAAFVAQRVLSCFYTLRGPLYAALCVDWLLDAGVDRASTISVSGRAAGLRVLLRVCGC